MRAPIGKQVHIFVIFARYGPIEQLNQVKFFFFLFAIY